MVGAVVHVVERVVVLEQVVWSGETTRSLCETVQSLLLLNGCWLRIGQREGMGLRHRYDCLDRLLQLKTKTTTKTRLTVPGLLKPLTKHRRTTKQP